MCVCGAEIALFLFWPSPLIKPAQQYLSLSLSVPCFLSISLLRSLGSIVCFFPLLFVALQAGISYFLLHQRSFRVPTHSIQTTLAFVPIPLHNLQHSNLLHRLNEAFCTQKQCLGIAYNQAEPRSGQNLVRAFFMTRLKGHSGGVERGRVVA